ncbi:MAG: hypothetical protein MR355_03955 [Lachnospiraceae bacterium]|nr:hypothetical protein [Lachnospiraceae bacterium]
MNEWMDFNGDGKVDGYEKVMGAEMLCSSKEEHEALFGDTENYHGSSYTPSRKGGMSTLGAILSVVAGLILQCVLYVALGIDVENVPALVIVILWAVFSTLAAVMMEKIGL